MYLVMIRERYHLALFYIVYFFIKVAVLERPSAFGNILILAPHPDDEIFGAGGVILQCLEQGKEVHILFLTDGEGSGVHPDSDLIKRERSVMTEAVRAPLGIPSSHLHRLHLPDGDVPDSADRRFEQVSADVAELIDRIKPDTVLATHPLDFWPYDHVACAEIAENAILNTHHRPGLYLYWVWAWYNIRPRQLLSLERKNLSIFPLGRWREQKKDLVNAYLDRTTPDGIPWSGDLPKALRRSFFLGIEILEKRELL